MSGEVKVERTSTGIIHAAFRGTMTEELLLEAQKRIRGLLKESEKSRILYDGRFMQDPSMTLTLLMKSFEAEIRGRVERAAAVVPGPRIAFLSRLAFEHDSSTRIIYDDIEAAQRWLAE